MSHVGPIRSVWDGFTHPGASGGWISAHLAVELGSSHQQQLKHIDLNDPSYCYNSPGGWSTGEEGSASPCGLVSLRLLELTRCREGDEPPHQKPGSWAEAAAFLDQHFQPHL